MRKLLCLFGLLLLMWNCRKETTRPAAAQQLEFSQDTVFLDTVFTTIGSSTRILKVKNPANEDVRIPMIRLGRGNASYFRMNVNGTSGTSVADIELLAKDSLYILIEVTADVMGAPDLLYTDSIVFDLQANQQQDVQLVTLAKNAYFHLPDRADTIGNYIVPYSAIANDTTWSADLPHVVYGYVLVGEDATLTIPAETQVHFHSGSGMIVAGSLQTDPLGLSDYDQPVVFQGDRLEPWYSDVPGQWGGLFGGLLFLGSSQNNVLNNTLIKNATIAVRLDSNNSGTSNVRLSNTRIYNSSRVGLYGGFGHLEAENLIVGNSGLYDFFALGGRYHFRHSTFASFGSGRSTPSIGLFNFFEDAAGNERVRELLDCYFGNCIIYGNRDTEILIGENTQGIHNYLFRNVLLRVESDPEDNSYNLNDPSHFDQIVQNQDPAFRNYTLNRFDLDTLSPAMDKGNLQDGSLVPLDIKGELRSFNGIPDLGAYERIE